MPSLVSAVVSPLPSAPPPAALWPGQPPGTRLACSLERQSQDDEFGIDAQYAANAALARREGYFIPNDPAFRFSDNDVSGRLRQRQGLERLLAVIRSPAGASFVRAYATERERAYRHRDPRRLYALEIECEDAGVLIRYGDEPDPDAIDPGEEGDSARAVRFIGSAVRNVYTSAEWEKIRRRTRKGRRWRVMQGFYPASFAPYGLERWLVDMSTGAYLERVEPGCPVQREGCAYRLRWTEGPEVEVIRRAFDAAEAGASLRSIARALNHDGIAPPAGRLPFTLRTARVGWEVPLRWTGESVRALLHQLLYCGDFVWGEDASPGEAPVPHTSADPYGTHPILYREFVADPPVTRAQWERVNALLRGRPARGGRKRADPSYLLGGQVVCGACGRVCHGMHIKSQDGGPGRRSYRHYRPPLAPTAVCPHENRRIAADELHPVALALTRAALGDPGLRAEVAEELRRQRVQAVGPEHRDRAEKLRRAITRYDRAAEQACTNAALATAPRAREIHNGAAERHVRLGDEARRELEVLEAATARLKEAESRLDAANKSRSASNARDLVAELEQASPVMRRRMVQEVVREVRVDFAARTAEFVVLALT